MHIAIHRRDTNLLSRYTGIAVFEATVFRLITLVETEHLYRLSVKCRLDLLQEAPRDTDPYVIACWIVSPSDVIRW